MKELTFVIKRNALRASMLAFVVMAGACKDKPAPAPAAAAPQQPERDATFAQDSLKDWFIDSSVSDVPGSQQEITAMYGPPDSIVQLASANAQDPMTFDTVFEIHYPTLVATILKVGQNETLQSVWVSDSTHIVGPVRIGSDTSDLRRLLGPPMLGGDKPGYVCAKCSIANESVRFDLVNGKVTGMLFDFPGN